MFVFRVSCLCTQIEAVLQHQLKSPTKGLSITALRQAAVGPGFEEITFWQFVKHHLTKHEVERYQIAFVFAMQNVR